MKPLDFSAAGIKKLLDDLDETKACGPDDLAQDFHLLLNFSILLHTIKGTSRVIGNTLKFLLYSRKVNEIKLKTIDQCL